MKFFASQFAFFLQSRATRRNTRLLFRFFLILTGIVIAYSIIFHFLMELEGRDYSWITGFYWTLTVMSTLGFGDITFVSDLGKIFSIIVLLSGILFLLVLLPFTFIQFFYAPWMAAQTAARAPRELPGGTTGHVILTRFGPITGPLIRKLKFYGIPYAILVPDVAEALKLHDEDLTVVVGDLDDPETYRHIRVDKAALVAATSSDTINTNVTFTVREVSSTVPIVATANEAASVDILSLAGANQVFRWGEMMGRTFARHTVGGDAIAHVIGQMDQILFAEANSSETPLVGKTLREAQIRELTGITVLGILDRGSFEFATPDTNIGKRAVLLLAGERKHIETYNELFCIYHAVDAPVIIIGGGRVGRAAGRMLSERQIHHRIIEKLPERIRDRNVYVEGDAAELDVLERAGIMKTPAVLITTHDDDTNIYLTIYCRKLRPDIQIISRATLERNTPTLYRAGADLVLSYASLGANTIFNFLKRGSVLMIDEGLNVFKVGVPAGIAGKTLGELWERTDAQCWVIGLRHNEQVELRPDPATPLRPGSEIILIGSTEAEYSFLEHLKTR